MLQIYEDNGAITNVDLDADFLVDQDVPWETAYTSQSGCRQLTVRIILF